MCTFPCTIWFSTLYLISGFLWHSSKWANWFSRFLWYMSRFKMLSCSIDVDPNYVTTVIQLCPTLNYYVKLRQLFRCILIDRYITFGISVLSLCLWFMLPAWLLHLTLYECTSIHINFLCLSSWKVIILATFKSILSQSICYIKPKNFLRGLCPLKP